MTILIPTKDRVRDLQRLIRSLATQSDKNFDILVVNNGNREITNAIKSVARDLSIRILPDSTPNLPHLFNHALNRVNSDIIAYLNDDTEVNPSWVQEIRQTFAEHRDVAVVGGPAIDQQKQLMRRMQGRLQKHPITRAFFRIVDSVLYEGKFFEIGYMSNWGTYSIGGSLPYSARLPVPLEVDALSVTNMAIRREFLGRIGGFDEAFIFSHADGDLFVRLRKINAKLVFNPRLSVLHYSSPTEGSTGTRSAFWLSRDYMLFLRKLQPSRLNDRVRMILTLLGLISFWAWVSISTRHLGLAVSSLEGLGAGLKVRPKVEDLYQISKPEHTSSLPLGDRPNNWS